MEQGITSLQSCLKSAREMSDTIGDILADGKISIADIMKLPALFKEINAIVAASKDAVVEIKDLDASEAQMLLAEVLDLVASIAGKFGVAA